MTHKRATMLLKLAAAISTGFGLAMFLTLLPGLNPVMAQALDLIFLPVDGKQGFASDSELLLGAISGGLLAGLGIMSWQVTTLVFARDPDTGRRILTAGILGWFLVDGTGSVLAGAWFNVVLNTGFLALFLVPLMLFEQEAQPRTA